MTDQTPPKLAPASEDVALRIRSLLDGLYGRPRPRGVRARSRIVTRRRRQLLEVLLNPDSAGRSRTWLAEKAGVPVQLIERLARHRAFTTVVLELRRLLWESPERRQALSERIYADAMTPLAESEDAAALVRTREQAAAITGLPLKPEVPLPPVPGTSPGELHLHYHAAPEHVLEHYARTGEWRGPGAPEK